MKTRQTKETSEQGKVKRDIYVEYAKSSNLGAVAVYLVLLLGAQTGQIGELHSSLAHVCCNRLRHRISPCGMEMLGRD